MFRKEILTEEIIRKEFAYKVRGAAGGELRHYYDHIAVDMWVELATNEIRLRITNGEVSFSVWFDKPCLSWSLDNFSDRILAPLVPKFLPDDREFAIESPAYAA